MAGTATVKAPLGATTGNRKWYLDVDTAADPAIPAWIGVFGIQEFQDALAGNLQDDSDFDSGGWQSQTNTANAWSIVTKVKRAPTATDATTYDPGQEELRAASSLTGVGNRVHVRWYEMEPNGPRVEAYEGWAAVSWSPDGGDMTALSTVTVTLTGQGARNAITHPDTTV